MQARRRSIFGINLHLDHRRTNGGHQFASRLTAEGYEDTSGLETTVQSEDDSGSQAEDGHRAAMPSAPIRADRSEDRLTRHPLQCAAL